MKRKRRTTKKDNIKAQLILGLIIIAIAGLYKLVEYLWNL